MSSKGDPRDLLGGRGQFFGKSIWEKEKRESY